MLSAGPQVTIDARWLGYSGVGRLTEVLLRGLAEINPPGRWLVWGPRRAESFAWGATRFVRTDSSPLDMVGQRGRAQLPRGLVVFPHVVRPLPRRRSVVIVHDTIPIRWADPAWQRPLQRLFYATSARAARRVVVYSDATERRVREELGVDPRKIHRAEVSVDLESADRTLARRAAQPHSGPSRTLLYVGIDRPHKNLTRAMQAFATSEFASSGGRFVLVGVQQERLAPLRRQAATVSEAIEIRGRCSDEELEAVLASAAALIQPSLEEGLGLTVMEALASGLPACCTRYTALEEAAKGCAELFDGQTVPDIARAIDACVATAAAPATVSEVFRQRLPPGGSTRFAADVLEAVEAAF